MIRTIIAISILLASCSIVRASSTNEFQQLDSHVSNVYRTTIISDKDMIFSDKERESLRGKKEDASKSQDIYKKWKDILNSRNP